MPDREPIPVSAEQTRCYLCKCPFRRRFSTESHCDSCITRLAFQPQDAATAAATKERSED